jgi:hypothetical protein
MNKTKKKRRSRNRLYSKGQVNYIIDSVCHPLAKVNRNFILLDGVLHGLVEKDPVQTAKKFVKYNLPTIIEEIRKLVE